MKFAREWGSGHTIVRESISDLLRRHRSRPRSGGSGTVVSRDDRRFGGYILKIVGFRKKDGTLNDMFWKEARSVSLFTSIPQNVPGCVRCPLPVSYWIREDDPLYREFLRSGGYPPSPRLLIDFISIFGIEPEQLTDLGIDDPGAYRLAPSPLLERIRDDCGQPRAAGKKTQEQLPDLLLAYPIGQGGSSLAECFGRHSVFNDPSEVLRMVCHILSAILTLYRKGLAHGDVKPANIMRPDLPRSTGQPYFLTDIGSLHAGDTPSATGSAMFFAHDVFEKWRQEPDKEKQNRKFIGKDGFEPDTPCSGEVLNRLLRRTLMDGHALAVTLWSLARGREPASPLLKLSLVDEKWHCDELTEIFGTLYRVDDLTIGAMQKIADRLRKKFPYRDIPAPPLQTYGKEAEIGFDVEWIEKINDKVKLEYGKLSEQLSFTGRCNPMLRLHGKISSSWLPDEAVMQPVIRAYSSGNKLVSSIFYAPDDAETGSRAVDFEKYQPCTLAYLLDNGGPTKQDVARITALGRLIDEVMKDCSSRDPVCHLPYPHDIVKIGGDWMIMPFFLSPMRFGCPMSFEEYFKMLCGRENGLSAQNWADLVFFDHDVGILFELLPDEMVPRIAELLDDASSVDPESLPDRNERREIEGMHELRRLLLACKPAKFAGFLEPERQDRT